MSDDIKVQNLTRSGQLFVPRLWQVKWTGWTGQMGKIPVPLV